MAQAARRIDRRFRRSGRQRPSPARVEVLEERAVVGSLLFFQVGAALVPALEAGLLDREALRSGQPLAPARRLNSPRPGTTAPSQGEEDPLGFALATGRAAAPGSGTATAELAAADLHHVLNVMPALPGSGAQPQPGVGARGPGSPRSGMGFGGSGTFAAALAAAASTASGPAGRADRTTAGAAAPFVAAAPTGTTSGQAVAPSAAHTAPAAAGSTAPTPDPAVGDPGQSAPAVPTAEASATDDLAGNTQAAGTANQSDSAAPGAAAQ